MESESGFRRESIDILISIQFNYVLFPYLITSPLPVCIILFAIPDPSYCTSEYALR
jgi:hypothetical protein